MQTYQSLEEFAVANGFHSLVELLAASQSVPDDVGVGHFSAMTADGHEILWNGTDVDPVDATCSVHAFA